MDASLKQSKRQKDSMIYASMKSVHLVQQQLKLVAHNMDSWNKARKAYAKNPGKFTGRSKLTKYHPKGGLATIIIDNQTAKLWKNGYVEIPCMDKFRVKLAHPETTTIQELGIVPQNRWFIVEVVYKTNQIRSLNTSQITAAIWGLTQGSIMLSPRQLTCQELRR